MLSPAERARELIVYADGLEAAGMVDYARRARDVARDVLELTLALEAERSSSRALKARCETQQQILGKAAYEAFR